MKALPTLTIMIITYNRRAELAKTFEALYKNLYYDESVSYIIADDSTGGTYRESVLYDIGQINHVEEEVTFISTPKNRGFGANANNGIAHVKDDIFLFMEDDKLLTQELDITPYVALLLEHDGIGLVRLDGIGGHHIVCHCQETDISNYLPDYQQGVGLPGKLNYFLADHSSRETWLFSNRPSLRHKRFTNFYGEYPEGLKLGQTEEAMAHQVKDKMVLPNAPAIAIPLDATSKWLDIGRSYQHTEYDIEHNLV